MKYLLDTNILISQLKSPILPPPTQSGHYAISVITEAEVWRLPGMSNLEERLIDNLLSVLIILPIDSTIARTAAQLGRTRKTKLPDLLIAATAIETDIPLITKNIKDFLWIPDLKVYPTLS